DSTEAIVVATPGAEPLVDSGYAAAVLLDTWLPLNRADLRAAEEASRRWFNVATLVRSVSDGGRVIAVGDPSTPSLQALVRCAPAGYAAPQPAARRSARLAPTARMATIQAPPDVITEVLTMLDLPRYAEVLGPVDLGDGQSQVVVRSPRERGAQLSRALQQLQAARS